MMGFYSSDCTEPKMKHNFNGKIWVGLNIEAFIGIALYVKPHVKCHIHSRFCTYTAVIIKSHDYSDQWGYYSVSGVCVVQNGPRTPTCPLMHHTLGVECKGVLSIVI